MITEDWTVPLQTMGEEVTLAGVTARAFFDNAYGTQLDAIATAQPTLTIQQSLFPTTLTGATAVVRGVNYTVVGVEPDGTGWAFVRLEKV